MIPEHG